MDVTTNYALFDPRVYLNEYYATLFPENLDLLHFLVRTFRDLPPGGRVLDFGSGPTIYTAIVAAPYAGEIHLSDVSEANRNELVTWLHDDPTAFDWRATIRAVLELEGSAATSEQIAERADMIRQRVTEVLHCDARAHLPLGAANRRYDVVVSNMCLEAAADDLDEWRQCVHNLASLVKPGGILILTTVKRCHAYAVGNTVFQVLDIDEDDLRAALNVAGFVPDTIRCDWAYADHPVHPYEGLIFTVAAQEIERALG